MSRKTTDIASFPPCSSGSLKGTDVDRLNKRHTVTSVGKPCHLNSVLKEIINIPEKR